MADLKLSDYCILDHLEWEREGGPMPALTPQSVMWRTLLLLDQKMHFTGFRGKIWRLLGVDRSLKNPNLCNL